MGDRNLLPELDDGDESEDELEKQTHKDVRMKVIPEDAELKGSKSQDSGDGDSALGLDSDEL